MLRKYFLTEFVFTSIGKDTERYLLPKYSDRQSSIQRSIANLSQDGREDSTEDRLSVFISQPTILILILWLALTKSQKVESKVNLLDYNY